MPMPPLTPNLPRPAAALLRLLLPAGERDEVVAELAHEYQERRALGRAAARLWLWRQVVGSIPWLVRRSWWRGRTGFVSEAERFRPGGSMLEEVFRDLRHAGRRLRTRPTYTLLAVVTLALGVGGTAAVFGLVRTLLLDPLPYAAEEEVAVFWMPFDWSESEFLYLGPEVPGFSSLAAYRPEDVTLAVDGSAARLVRGISTTASLFDVLGVRPALGRGFEAGEDRPGASPLVVLSHGLWQELGADPSIVGRLLTLDGVARTVVGVMPRGFWFPDPGVRVWLPEPMQAEANSGSYAFLGRLDAPLGSPATSAALTRITEMLGERYTYPPDWDKTASPALTPLREYLVGSVRPSLLATLGAMAMILLMACANVTALMLGQLDSRSGELAVRSALGASRPQLLRQLGIEAIVLGLLAGAVGAFVATATFGVLTTALPLGALAESAALDWRLFLVALGIALLAAIAVTTIPAISLWRGDLRGQLSSARTAGIGGRGGRLESALVIAEIAVAVVMATGAALLIRSVANLRAIDPGVNTEAVAVLDIATGSDLSAGARRQLFARLPLALQEVPTVRAAAMIQVLPLRAPSWNFGIQVEGDVEQRGPSTTLYRIVTPGYFEAMDIDVLAGRTFQQTDESSEEPLVLINRALAERYFADREPIGRRISTGYSDGWARIIGVVDNAADGFLVSEPAPARYMLQAQVPFVAEMQALVLRVAPGVDPASVLDDARAAVQRAAPAVAVQNVTTMGRVFNESMGATRQITFLLVLLASLALVLGAVGVYGVVSQFVRRRRRDWSIRIALGLRPADVVTRIVARGGALVAAGAILGIVAALATSRILASFLYGVGTADPVATAGAVVLLAAAGVLAALFPAVRASRTDPARVLREQ